MQSADKGIVRVASLCLTGRGMTRRRLTLVRFAKSMRSPGTRRSHTPKRGHAGRAAGLQNVKRWCRYEASSFQRALRGARSNTAIPEFVNRTRVNLPRQLFISGTNACPSFRRQAGPAALYSLASNAQILVIGQTRKKLCLQPSEFRWFSGRFEWICCIRAKTANLIRLRQTYYLGPMAFAVHARPVIRCRITQAIFAHTPKGKLP